MLSSDDIISMDHSLIYYIILGLRSNLVTLLATHYLLWETLQ